MRDVSPDDADDASAAHDHRDPDRDDLDGVEPGAPSMPAVPFMPAGAEEGPYDWYTRGLSLLAAGSAAAAEQVLARAAVAEPESRSVLEALGRAQFKARHYNLARETFARLTEANPADDYAQFALGLSATRLGDLRSAVEHLALAAAMRPDLAHYGRELRMARARLEGAP